MLKAYTPMFAIDMPGWPGISRGSEGFSTKLVTRKFSSTPITPKPLASAFGTSTQATVTSARLRAWNASSLP